MAVISRSAVKLRVGISDDDVSEDGAIDALILQCQALAEAYLNYSMDYAVRTETYSGTGREWLALYGKPVFWIPAVGDITDGSAVITGLDTTTGVIAGMPVAGEGIPSGATVSTVNSTTQVTMSAAATETDTDRTVTFGLSVWVDDSGAFGQGTARLGTEDTLLVPFSDYELRLDGRGAYAGQSISGLLQRVGSYWPRWSGRRAGLLAPFVEGPLASQQGNNAVRVQYASGWTSATLPADIRFAILEIVAIARDSTPHGATLSSQSFDGYSRSINTASIVGGNALAGYLAGAGGAMLRRWRRIVVG